MQKSKLHILDALGIAFPAYKLKTTRRIVKALARLGAKPESTALVHGFKTSANIAAIVNGTPFGAMDFDDLHEQARLHPTAVILPAVLSVCEANGDSGRDLITAYMSGAEVMCRLGSASTERFHQRGIQATSACGSVASALAVGKLLGLSRRQLISAMGIATNLAIGSSLSVRISSYLSNVDPGRAAETGLIAAFLASGNVSLGMEDVLEGPFGFFRTYTSGGDDVRRRLVEGIGDIWEMNRTFIKRYPLGYDFTRYIDAVLALRAEHHFVPSDVAEVIYGDNSTAVNRFSEPARLKKRPATWLEASTSRYFVLATAISEGKITRDSFSPSKMADPSIHRLMDRTRYVLDECSHWVEVVLKSGEKHRMTQGELIPTSPERVVRKFYDNASAVIGTEKAKSIRSLVERLEGVNDVGVICRQMTFGKPA